MQIFYFLLSLVVIIVIWQAAIPSCGELTDLLFWLAEFFAGILVSQITDYRFLFRKSIAYFYFANYRFSFRFENYSKPFTPQASQAHVSRKSKRFIHERVTRCVTRCYSCYTTTVEIELCSFDFVLELE